MFIHITINIFHLFESIFHFYLQFNFVGRILGPRGMTAKQLEQETGCKIMVRGKGSMRDKKKVKFVNVFFLEQKQTKQVVTNKSFDI